MSLFAISYTIILHSSYYRTVPAIPEASSRGLQPRLQILPTLNPSLGRDLRPQAAAGPESSERKSTLIFSALRQRVRG